MPRYGFFVLIAICFVLTACRRTSPSSPSPSAPTGVPTSAVPTIAATATAPTGTVIKPEGQLLIVSHPDFYWTLKLPQDWVITHDTGFEIEANNPNQTGFIHLLSQTWLSKDRKPNARAYVDYWKNTTYGDLFPIFAEGTLVSETEINPDRLGGPYLRYEFDDSRHGLRYAQVYAAAGGPNALVVTGRAKTADYSSVQAVLDGILNSAGLMPEK